MTSCMIPLASSEVAWYNGYSPTKVPHSCDFQCVMHNMDNIKGCSVWTLMQIDHVSCVHFQSISFSTIYVWSSSWPYLTSNSKCPDSTCCLQLAPLYQPVSKLFLFECSHLPWVKTVGCLLSLPEWKLFVRLCWPNLLLATNYLLPFLMWWCQWKGLWV